MTYYDDISEGYEELHKEEQEKKIDFIKEHFIPKTTDKLLDVGCGTGLTTEPWTCKRHGIDPAPKLIARARQSNKIEYKVAPAEDIPYLDNSFDVIVSVTAIQNFSDLDKAFSEIKRVAKDNADFVLTFLKKSTKRQIIEQKIEAMFNVNEKLEEDKDIIYICK